MTREELIDRCRLERNAMIELTVAVRTVWPRGKKIAHWLRAGSRILRVILRSARDTSPPHSGSS